MNIPFQDLKVETLTAIIEEFISREGTDYGSYEVSLENKIDQVRGQLSRGEVLITFDPATENCNLLTRNQFQRYQSEQLQQNQDQQSESEF